MNRGKKIVLTSHCILNQNSVVLPLARAKGAYNDIVRVILDADIGILQLPCPELIHLGLKRPPMEKDDYDTPEYHALCDKLLEPVIKQLQFYLDAGYELVGIIGIDMSPTCSLSNKGILMETLLALLDLQGIHLRQIAVPTAYQEGQDTSFTEVLSKWLMINEPS